MRKMAGLCLLLAVTLGLAACGAQSAGAPTTAPTAVPAVPTVAAIATAIAAPTQAPVANPPEASVLGSGTWMWVQSVDASGASTPVTNSDKFRVGFDPAGGTVSIATTCQSATATYTTSGSALAISMQSETRAVCPGDTLSNQFIVELGSVQSFSLDGGQLVLQLGGGGGSLRLSH